MTSLEILRCPFAEVPDGNDRAVWIKLQLVCKVEYMMPREQVPSQPVFKGLRYDKTPKECQTM